MLSACCGPDDTLSAEQKQKNAKALVCAPLSSAVVTGLTLLLALTGGGLNVKGLQGASLSRCVFSPTDTSYEYPGQPSASDEPPYSTLFQDVCLGGGTERALPCLATVVNASETYVCSCCGRPLFSGLTKFDSRTGWPSFYAPYSVSAVGYSRDLMSVEVHCKTCGTHLGHVFDWPNIPTPVPTGLRYCINGVCLRKVANAALGALASGSGVYTENLPWLLPDLVVPLVVLLLVMMLFIALGNVSQALQIVLDNKRRATSTRPATNV